VHETRERRRWDSARFRKGAQEACTAHTLRAGSAIALSLQCLQSLPPSSTEEEGACTQSSRAGRARHNGRKRNGTHRTEYEQKEWCGSVCASCLSPLHRPSPLPHAVLPVAAARGAGAGRGQREEGHSTHRIRTSRFCLCLCVLLCPLSACLLACRCLSVSQWPVALALAQPHAVQRQPKRRGPQGNEDDGQGATTRRQRGTRSHGAVGRGNACELKEFQLAKVRTLSSQGGAKKRANFQRIDGGMRRSNFERITMMHRVVRECGGLERAEGSW
jgi:hypothetical protein